MSQVLLVSYRPESLALVSRLLANVQMVAHLDHALTALAEGQFTAVLIDAATGLLEDPVALDRLRASTAGSIVVLRRSNADLVPSRVSR